MTGAGDAMTGIAAPKIATIARGFIDMSDKNFCPSCGVDYVEHNGLIPTCAELQKAKLKIERLEKVLSDYRNEQLKFNKREVEKIGKL
jgi:hypothetical protein